MDRFRAWPAPGVAESGRLPNPRPFYNMTYFCPDCWKIIPADVAVCPFCRCDLAAADARSYPQKMIGALRHPEPETRQRAAEILGELQYPQAIPALLARARDALQERTLDIPFLAALLRAARMLGAPAQACQPIIDSADSRHLENLLRG